MSEAPLCRETRSLFNCTPTPCVTLRSCVNLRAGPYSSPTPTPTACLVDAGRCYI